MNRKERFLTAVKNQQPDRVPMFDFLFQRPLYYALIGREPDGYNAKDAIECALALNNDGVWLPFGGFNGFQLGYERIAYALYDNPGMLLDIFNISNEFNREAARLSVTAGVDAMWISDDLGDSSRGFMRLPHFQEYYST